MLIKIINNKLEDYNREYKVRRMNYDQVVVNYPNSEGMKVFVKEDVDFITEGEVDEFLIKYSDFLKIKLNRGISVALYKFMLETIESELEIKFESLNMLKDKYMVNKRGIWDKEILCVINDSIPLKISASGQNFKKNGFNINLIVIENNEFFEMCSFEIKKIQSEIEEKNNILARYGRAIEKIKNPENPVKMLL